MGTARAFEADNALVKALAHCGKGEPRNSIEMAQRMTRDCIVLRAQWGLPVKERDTFVAALEAAHGGKLKRNELSKLCHAHSKTIALIFDYAFPSNSQIDNAARQSGARGRRSRDAKRATAAAFKYSEETSSEDGGFQDCVEQDPEDDLKIKTIGSKLRPPPGLEDLYQASYS